MTPPPAHRRSVRRSRDGDVPDDPNPDARGMSAGAALLVGLVGLLFAGLLNADALVERAENRPFCTGQEVVCTRDLKLSVVWYPLQDLSHALRLSEPRARLDQATGRRGAADDDRDVSEIIADAQGTTSTTDGDRPASTTTTTIPDPVVRTPTAAAPLRLWVGGDSMVETFGTSFQRISASTGVITPTLDFRVSTGLTRPDYFNWPAHLADSVLPTDPEVMVIMFGANDSQPLELDDGTILKRFEQRWLDEYRRRVAGTMDLLRDPDNDRVVLWVGQPVMGPTSGVNGMEQLNAIYSEEAAQRPWITYFDSWNFFANADGSYADRLPSLDGTVSGLRQPDDVHFSTLGGNRLSWAVLRRLGVLMDLSASVAAENPGEAPPTDIQERADIPPTSPGLIE